MAREQEVNPERIPAQSPGLRRRSYPGSAVKKFPNPERVAANRPGFRGQPDRAGPDKFAERFHLVCHLAGRREETQSRDADRGRQPPKLSRVPTRAMRRPLLAEN